MLKQKYKPNKKYLLEKVRQEDEEVEVAEP
jgi:hypothetical protein